MPESSRPCTCATASAFVGKRRPWPSESTVQGQPWSVSAVDPRPPLSTRPIAASSPDGREAACSAAAAAAAQSPARAGPGTISWAAMTKAAPIVAKRHGGPLTLALHTHLTVGCQT